MVSLRSRKKWAEAVVGEPINLNSRPATVHTITMMMTMMMITMMMTMMMIMMPMLINLNDDNIDNDNNIYLVTR